MESDEIKRANDLKEVELRLHIWKELFALREITHEGYTDALKYALNYVEKKES